MSATAASNLTIENLNKSYKVNSGDVEALQGINLDIRDGEFVSIVGSSGCGKSTLLRIIAGLENGYSGAVKVGGQKNPADRGSTVEWFFRNTGLFPG